MTPPKLLQTHIFMLWLGVLFGVFLLSLFRVRQHVFSLGVLLVIIGYLGTLNLMNVDDYIARRNIARYHEGSDLDFYYLQQLSFDATPAVVELYHNTPNGSEEAHTCAGFILHSQLARLDRLRESGGMNFYAANLGRDQAWALLDPLREQLSGYEERSFGEECVGESDDDSSRW